MNRQITRVAGLALGLLVVLIVATTYWQTWARPALAERQDNAIQRVAQFEIKRGLILSPATPPRLLARNKERRVGGRTFYFRRYPQGRLTAHVVGYSTAARSRTGLERSLNPALTGSARSLSSLVDQSLNKLNGKPIVGDSVVTTLDLNGQRAALEALGSNCGAVVALDPRTGRVRVMVSSPSYNPNDVEQNFGRIEKIRADCKPASPLLNRATPGALPAGLDLQGRDRVGSARLAQVHARLDLQRSRVLHRLRQACQQLRHRAAVWDALARDRAPVLGQLGLLQHRSRARRQADPQAGQEVRLLRAAAARDARERAARERPLQQGTLYEPKRDSDVDAGRMAFGQERLLVTPEQMAMVAGTIGNDGILMRPFVVEKILTPSGKTRARTKPTKIRRAVTPATARDVKA